MVVWFLFEPLVFHVNKKLKIFKVDEEMLQRLEKDKDVVYTNPYVPRVDDFLFNIIGVVIYVLCSGYINKQ